MEIGLSGAESSEVDPVTSLAHSNGSPSSSSINDFLQQKLFASVLKRGPHLALLTTITFNVSFEGKGLKFDAHNQTLVSAAQKLLFKPNDVTQGRPVKGSIVFQHCSAKLRDFVSFLCVAQDLAVIKKLENEINVKELTIQILDVRVMDIPKPPAEDEDVVQRVEYVTKEELAATVAELKAELAALKTKKRKAPPGHHEDETASKKQKQDPPAPSLEPKEEKDQ